MSAVSAALSTIALTCYNLLARNGEAGAEQLAAHPLMAQQFPKKVTTEWAQEALDELKSRGRIADGSSGGVVVVDKLRRMVTKRSTENDGWDDWQVQGPTGLVLLDEVIQ